MSPTDMHDLTDDGVDRALRADAEQWRASHPAPSLDDAVRRLVAEDRTPARHRSGWWRPVAVAAAVLVLLGGVIGVVAVTARHRSEPVTQVANEPMWPPMSPDASANLWVGATLRSLPTGFVGVDQPVASGVGSPQGPGPYIPPLVERSWFRSRSSASGVSVSESLELIVGGPSVTEHSIPINAPKVRGHVASLTTSDAVADTSSQVMRVSWVEDGRGIGLSYTGPRKGAGAVQPLTFDDLLTIARSFTGPSPASPPKAVTSLVPGFVTAGSVKAELTRTRSFSARRTSDGRLEVELTGGPASNLLTASHCNPYEQTVVTGADAGSVTLTVGSYIPLPTEPERPCVLVLYPTRWVPVTLDGPLGSRTVIDGSTGKPVALSGS